MLSLARNPGEEVIDVAGDFLVELILGPFEREGLGPSVPLGEEPLALEVPEVLFHAAEVPGVAFELNDLLVSLEVDELILVEQSQKVAELISVALVRGGGEKKQALSLRRKTLDKLEPVRLRDLLSVGSSRALVRLVDNHRVPVGLEKLLSNLGPLGEVDRGDATLVLVPRIGRERSLTRSDVINSKVSSNF